MCTEMQVEENNVKHCFSIYLLNFKVNAHDDQVVGSLFAY